MLFTSPLPSSSRGVAWRSGSAGSWGPLVLPGPGVVCPLPSGVLALPLVAWGGWVLSFLCCSCATLQPPPSLGAAYCHGGQFWRGTGCGRWCVSGLVWIGLAHDLGRRGVGGISGQAPPLPPGPLPMHLGSAPLALCLGPVGWGQLAHFMAAAVVLGVGLSGDPLWALGECLALCSWVMVGPVRWGIACSTVLPLVALIPSSSLWDGPS